LRHVVAIVIALFFIMNLVGCGGVQIPRKSFVKIMATFEAEHCHEGECLAYKTRSTASGSIVSHDWKTYILTAGHVCDKEYIEDNVRVDGLTITYYVLDTNGISHKAKVYRLDRANDLCILETNRLGFLPIRVRNFGPAYGDKLYNLAAPAGLMQRGFLPILEGRYSGITESAMVFTIPAMGGSSGSPIFDEQGRLVGMIMSVNRKFPFISYSPHHAAILDILKDLPTHE